jgi:hypothetical protein
LAIMNDTARNVSTDSIERPFQPPVECTSWCADGNGHRRDHFISDQACVGPDARIVTAGGDLIASLRRDVGGPTIVAVAIESADPARPLAELQLSPDTFRAFVEMARKAVCDVRDDHAQGDR